MEQELKDRLHDAQVCSPAQNYCRNRHIMEEAVHYIEALEDKLDKAVAMALEECPFRDGSGAYNDWWFDRKAALAELTGGRSGSET